MNEKVFFKNSNGLKLCGVLSNPEDDVSRPIKYLKSLGYSKIGLFGSSFGGAASIIASSKTNDLEVLVLRSPILNYLERELGRSSPEQLEEWKNKGYKDYFDTKGNKYKLNYTFFEDFSKNDCHLAAKKIKIPTLIIHGEADTSAPIEQSKKMVEILPNGKLEIIPGASHYYSEPEQYEKHLELIINFISENI